MASSSTRNLTRGCNEFAFELDTHLASKIAAVLDSLEVLNGIQYSHRFYLRVLLERV
jgi:hypothetical protein